MLYYFDIRIFLVCLLLLILDTDQAHGRGGFRSSSFGSRSSFIGSRSSSRGSLSSSRSSRSSSRASRPSSRASRSTSRRSRPMLRTSSPMSAQEWVQNYRAPGYGTNYGTKFRSSSYKYVSQTKVVGLGVGAGFLPGYSFGLAGHMAMYGIYDRYLMYMYLMGNPFYPHCLFGCLMSPPYQSMCYSGCPDHTTCRLGICECNSGYEKRQGSCQKIGLEIISYKAPADPFANCSDSATCFKMDINLVCNSTLGKCACRNSTRWNQDHCQIYVDVDCSKITYQTPPSPAVLVAANKTMQVMDMEDKGEVTSNETSIEARLQNSLLSNIDKDNVTKDEILEAFCRDVDTFSIALAQEQGEEESKAPLSTGAIVGIVIGLILLVAFLVWCSCRSACTGFIAGRNIPAKNFSVRYRV